MLSNALVVKLTDAPTTLSNSKLGFSSGPSQRSLAGGWSVGDVDVTKTNWY